MNSLFSRIGKVPRNSGFSMEGYHLWCPSVIKGDDGLFHLFASRWPNTIPFHPGWMVASEVVHATSNDILGPYEFRDVALPARGAEYWDGRSTHNPKILKHKENYIIVYMGSTHPFQDVQPGEPFLLDDPRCIVGRSNKRVGIAISKNLNGPWQRFDGPILPTKPNTFYSFLTSNPSLIIHEDESAYLMFKSRKYEGHVHSPMFIGVAKAPHFTGPYTVIGNKPIFGPGYFGEVEDPYVWKDSSGFHMIAKDMYDKLAGEHHAGFLANSPDGVKWELDPQPKAYSRTITWDDGEKQTLGQMERPFAYVENGKVTHLFFGVMDGPGGFNNSTRSWNLVIPLS